MKKKPVQSRSSLGGTLIGLVVGLLVGLGIALAVAVYVTRVPIPFVDRNVSRNAGQDALETERNKGWNPNKALNGDAVTTPAPAAAAAPEAAGAIVVPPADGKGLPPVPAAGSKPAADPLGELAQSRLGTTPPATSAGAPAGAAPAPGADPFTYFVQAGAFRSPEDAESQRAKLAMLGINADVTEREQSGRTVYRVRVGPFNQKALADLTQEQLQANGVEAALVRVQR
ncbi:SPOR domain-containing protein [Hydrogenophaga sp.]|uniref:SPOR domain-containing protein n=1 Tax=Hydrogenophaga sp. TaxID=1904254 RepID=UPI002730A6F3|nr:SPOR domain-containing protein [Hydrogenophaga sp.]MDP2016919.1 SPOR domain-containing protein [Hydrogenophaga sp.]MDP3164043.1 SPOR domain-containing protein [Hydrogenophaga sp.]MDP3812491.1 SPOR domain-containing protein [Hydrogenophaga sp.]